MLRATHIFGLAAGGLLNLESRGGSRVESVAALLARTYVGVLGVLVLWC